MLTDGAGEKHLVIAARAHGTRRQEAGSQLGAACRAASVKLDEGAAVRQVPIYGQDGPGGGLHMHDVIALTPVLVRVLERSPSCGEREPAVIADQVP